MLLAFVVLSVLLSDLRPITGAVSAFLAIGMMADFVQDDGRKSRAVAIIASFVPGVAAIYLGRWRRFAAFVPGYAAFPLLIHLAIEDAIGDWTFAMSIVGLIFSMISASLVDADRLSDQMGLTDSGPYDPCIRNFRLAYVSSVLLGLLFSVPCPLADIVTGVGDPRANAIIVIAWFACLIAVSAYARRRVPSPGRLLPSRRGIVRGRRHVRTRYPS